MSVFQRIFNSRGGDLKKKLFTVIVWVIIAVVAMAAVGNLFGSDDGKKTEDSGSQSGADRGISSAYDYISREEKNLSEKLSRVSGAGTVTVAVSVDDIGESVLARNVSTSNEQSGEEGENSSSRDETVVLKGGSGNGEPIVVAENMPKISGVVVISSGAGDERIKNELYESVKALYGIPSHRIKILAGNQ